jgi:glycolate oxidase FAD binding subunit
MPDVVTPATVDDVSSVLRGTDATAVVARGGGTKPHWGAPPHRCDLVVDLHRLDQVVDHAAGDMVVQVQAGVRLDRLAAVLAEAGQQLAVDVPSYDDGTVLDAGTVGGALAVGLAGPRRLRYGPVRDLVLGVTMVRADGAVASAGSRVVKNVAGYDLGKLLCGSYGTLGVVVAAILRLHPLPAATGWVTTRAPDPATAYGRARALLDSQLVPAAVELDRPGVGEPVTVAALFEGTGDGVASRAEAAAGLVGGTAGGQPPAWFGRFPGGPGGVLVEVRFPPAGLVGVLDLVDAAARGSGLPAVVRGSTGPAALQVGLAAEPEPLTGFLSHLRDGLARYGGHALVRHAPEPVRAAVDVWGPFEAGTLRLMQRVKDQFDPDHRLAPGSFLRGI